MPDNEKYYQLCEDADPGYACPVRGIDAVVTQAERDTTRRVLAEFRDFFKLVEMPQRSRIALAMKVTEMTPDE